MKQSYKKKVCETCIPKCDKYNPKLGKYTPVEGNKSNSVSRPYSNVSTTCEYYDFKKISQEVITKSKDTRERLEREVEDEFKEIKNRVLKQAQPVKPSLLERLFGFK